MGHHELAQIVVLIAVLGVTAQWLAWRFRLPAIVLLTAAGLVVGPGLGWLQPDQQFGELLKPMIGLAVAVILFEGGLHLRFGDLRGIKIPVIRMVLVAVPIAWLLGAASAHYLAGLDARVALLLGAILVVTGPTVIIPLLRQAKLERDTASVLKWEGIVVDPVGALLAVVVLEYATLADDPQVWSFVLSGAAILAASAIGYGAGKAFAYASFRGYVAEFLKGPAVLGLVLASYLAGNTLQSEAGLAAVTVLGITLANTGLANIDQVRHLKEYVTVLLVSGLFIILSASLDPSVLTSVNMNTLAFVAAMLFLVRPLSVLAATVGTSLTWRQSALVAWIAPRGIVAVSMSGLIATVLVAEDFADGAQLVPLTFAVVLATVVLHGFSITPFARFLGLAAGPAHGVLIVGASRWSTALAKALSEHEIDVTLTDTKPYRLAEARGAGIETYSCEILSELAEQRINFNQFEHLLAATDDDAYNALICTQFALDFGHHRTMQLAGHRMGDGGVRGVRTASRGQVLVNNDLDSDELDRRMAQGWRFRARDGAALSTARREALAAGEPPAANGDGSVVVAAITQRGEVRFNIHDKPLKVEEASTVLLFTSPDQQAA